MGITRRGVLRGAVGAVVAVGTANIGTAAASGRLERIKVPTRAGVFDAVAAGPKHGRKVLLLHGFPEFGIEWEAQLRALAGAGYRAVAPDQRGYSAGVRPAGIEHYQLDHLVRDVRGIADALGWGRFDLVGHDWGAAVAWVAAARYGGRVRSLTAVSVPHLGAFSKALREDPDQQERSKYMSFYRQPTPIPEDKLLSKPLAIPGVPAEHLTEYNARLREPGALTAALDWYRANDFTGYPDRVDVPTLFVASEDPAVAPSGIGDTKNWVTGPYRLEMVPGGGHFLPEAAAPVVSELLLTHLCGVR